MANVENIGAEEFGFDEWGEWETAVDAAMATALAEMQRLEDRERDSPRKPIDEIISDIHKGLAEFDSDLSGVARQLVASTEARIKEIYLAAASGEKWNVAELSELLKRFESVCRKVAHSAWDAAGEYTMKFLNPDRPGFSLNASDDPVAARMAKILEAHSVVENLGGLLPDGISAGAVARAIGTMGEFHNFAALCRVSRACLDRLSGTDVQVLPMDIESDLHNDLMCESEILHGRSRLYGREQGDSERHGMMPAIEESAVLLALGRLATTAAALAYVAHVTGEVPTEVGFLPSEDPVFPALPVELVVQAIEESLPRAQALLLAIAAERSTEAPENLGRLAKMLNAHIDSNGDLVTLREMFEAVEAHVPVNIDNLAEFARPDYPTVDMEQGSVWCEAGARVSDGYTANAIVLEDGRFSAKPWHEACGVAFESAPDRVSDVLPVAGGSAADMSFRDAQRICFNTENQKMVAVVEGGDCLMVHRGCGNDFPVYRKESLRDALAERYVVVLDAKVGEMHRSVSAGEKWDAAALTDILEGYEKVCREVGAPADENAGQYALKFLHPNKDGVHLHDPDDPVAARMVSAVHACQDLRNIASGEMECNANEVADALNTLRYAGQNDILTLTEDLPALGAAGLVFWKTVDPFLDDRTKEDCLACDERGRLVLEVAGSFRALDFTSCLVEVAPEKVGLTQGEMSRLRDEMDVEAVSSSGMALVAERGNSGRIEGWTVKDVLEMKAELAPRRGNAAARCIAEAVRESVRSAPAPAREAETGRRSGGLKL